MLLRFEAISKRFPGVQALSQVTFEVPAGSVHAVCGENGAGKSTLLKVLSGSYSPDSGTVLIDGHPATYSTPHEALSSGVAVIYQELHLVPELTVAENILLGHLPTAGLAVNRRELVRRASQLMNRVGLTCDPSTRVGDLSLAQRQLVEIAKALSRDARLIAFDEPTSSLSAVDVDKLFSIIAELKAEGRAILYVSHRMDEIKRISDACTVLRDGQLIETFHSLAEVPVDEIVRRMVGRDIDDIFGYTSRELGEPRLKVKGIAGPGLRSPMSLEVRSGEIVGLFGLVGAGRTELLMEIFAGQSGEVVLDGNRLPRAGPRSNISHGLVFCPEDRKGQGIIPMLSVSENINLSVRRLLARFGVLLNHRLENENTTKMMGQLQVKAASPSVAVSTLSGGNQQKVILARWLSENVRAILLDEPTRGVDVGAKSEIYSIIRRLAEEGVAILLVSSELTEVMGICDRILVLREGEMAGELGRHDATEERLLTLALPVSRGQVA